MPLLNYRTRVAAHVTIDTGNIVAVAFELKLPDGRPVSFRLPTDWRPVQQVLQNQKTGSNRVDASERVARDVAWRITKDWIEAQLAIIETRMVTMAQVFLPYAVTATGESMYEYVAQHTNLLLGDGR
jgi:hypothetical protein